MTTNTGGDAFPVSGYGAPISTRGMTLRDWFATHADISNTNLHEGDVFALMGVTSLPIEIGDKITFGARLAAKLRYACADAMIAERASQ